MSIFKDSSTFQLILKCFPEKPALQGSFSEKAAFILRGSLLHRRETISEKT